MPDTVKQHASKLVRKFDEREEKSEIVNSAEEICKSILSTKGVCKSHMRFLLRYVQCLISECNGKFSTRYRSKKVVELAIIGSSDLKIQHEHVFTVKSISMKILDNHLKYREYLSDVVGCVVLEDEHRELCALGDRFAGWNRYKSAGIEVYDMATSKLVDFNQT